ncbi:ABC transporter permease [Cohnella soli]|uniref:ABC transporter permease n=1 Tax=Cohnella soli TaxID=425005 RepID=A0ABW0I2B3_9BACL
MIWRELNRNRALYSLALPGLLVLIAFFYLPMFGHLIAFKNYNYFDGLWGSKWSGWANFKFFFGSSDWLRVTTNTLFLNALFIVFGLIVSVSLAIFLNEIRLVVFKRVAQSMAFLPFFVSWMVVSMMLFSLLNTSDGLINRTLKDIGMDPISWYNKPHYWPAILTIISVWKTAGYQAVIYLAAITGISPEYYESAQIDGATKWQRIYHITLPLLRPTIIVLTLLAIGRIFYGDFGMIFGLVGDNGVLYSTTDVIDTYAYRALRQLGNFGMSSAIGLYQSVLGLVTIVVFNAIIRKVDKESSIF